MCALSRGFPTLLMLVVLLGACASTRSAGDPSLQTNPNVLTQEQISRHRTAYEAVEALRANWLRARGPGSFSQPGQIRVYLDGTPAGGVEVLRSMATSGVAYIRFYDGIEAASRWGLGHENGVIFVSSSRR